MPYKSLNELPESVKDNLPKHAQEIYKSSFNSAIEQYEDETRSHKTAWAAVKNDYEKDSEGNWRRKDN